MFAIFVAVWWPGLPGNDPARIITFLYVFLIENYKELSVADSQ